MIKDYGMILASLTIFSKCMVPATRVDAKKQENKKTITFVQNQNSRCTQNMCTIVLPNP